MQAFKNYPYGIGLFSSVYTVSLSVHFVGNKTNNTDLFLSDSPVLLDSEMSLRMKEYFLKGITKQAEKFEFTHVDALEYNEVFNTVGQTFEGELNFHEASKKLARMLHDKSIHPNIKSGELFLVHFDNIYADNIPVEALGIFKSENKDGIFQIRQTASKFDIDYLEGISASKIDKGCLVLDLDFETGFEVLILDNVSKGDEALYWKEDFLNVQPINDTYTQTRSLMNLTKDFIEFQVKKDVEDIEKPDQIAMLNKSVHYFKANDHFNPLNFEKEVFTQPEISDSFRNYSSVHQQAYGLDFNKDIELSGSAVRKESKIFKSILKLDKNFHIYIHGDRSKIERGVDEDGEKFYKIYYREEN